MQTIVHDNSIVEFVSDEILINNPQDLLSLMANHQMDTFIIKKENINPEFFDLQTGLAGEILQKISNYQKRLAIVGDYSNLKSKSLAAFIYESNKTKQVIFVDSVKKALEIFDSKSN